MPHPRLILVSLFLPALFPSFAHWQGPIVPPAAPAESARSYPNSSEGLRLQLQDILIVAREHDVPKLESLIKLMEIPNYETWFTKTFGKEKGASWAGSYGRNLTERERDLASLFLKVAVEEGELEIRKVNEAPKPGIERRMIDTLQERVDIFYSGWNQRQLQRPFSNELVGYFVFLDGRFRWDSTIMPLIVRITGSTNAAPPGGLSGPVATVEPDRPAGNALTYVPVRPGVDGVTFPECSFCPDPSYPEEARAKHLEGMVAFTAVITPDGRAEDITLVKTSDPIFTQNASEAIQKWRFRPARGPDGIPVPVTVPFEITFRLAH
jgi:TonB family protein